MTRDDHRAECIEAIKAAIRASIPDTWEPMVEEAAIGVLSFLHGVAFVNPIKATVEMIGSGQTAEEEGMDLGRIFKAMSAAGDLTNPPEEKDNAPRVSGLAEHWPTNQPEEKP